MCKIHVICQAHSPGVASGLNGQYSKVTFGNSAVSTFRRLDDFLLRSPSVKTLSDDDVPDGDSMLPTTQHAVIVSQELL